MSKRRHISDGQRERVFAMTGGACFYCGYAATCLDHIMPHSYVANDTDDNLVPACDICNSIAGNQHFASLQAKKEYILAERASAKWQRKIGRMVVTVVRPAATGMPPAEPEPKAAPAPTPRTSNRRKSKPPKRFKSQPKVTKEPVVVVEQPEFSAHVEYLEDRPDYATILIEDLIEHMDDLTDEDADRLMEALIMRGMDHAGKPGPEKQFGPDLALAMKYAGGPVVYGRNEYGQVERVVL